MTVNPATAAGYRSRIAALAAEIDQRDLQMRVVVKDRDAARKLYCEQVAVGSKTQTAQDVAIENGWTTLYSNSLA